MTYSPYYSSWKDWPDTSTPITAAAMQHIETGIVNAGGGGSDSVLEATKHATSANILALHSAGLEVVAAPGSGKMILPINGYASYTPGATPYTVDSSNDNLQLTVAAGLASGFKSLVEIAGFGSVLGSLNQRTAAWSPNSKSDIASDWLFTNAQLDDEPLLLFYGSASDPTLGDGTLDVLVKYFVLDLP